MSAIVLVMKNLEFSIESTKNPLFNICLYSHLLSAWFCIDIVRRNSILVTHAELNGLKVVAPYYFFFKGKISNHYFLHNDQAL